MVDVRFRIVVYRAFPYHIIAPYFAHQLCQLSEINEASRCSTAFGVSGSGLSWQWQSVV